MSYSAIEEYERMAALGKKLGRKGSFEDLTEDEALGLALASLQYLQAVWPTDRQEWHDINDTLELIDYLPFNMNHDGELAEWDEETEELVDAVG